jgi:hypothetical protein
MGYRLFFIITLMLGALPLAAQPETERHYRVELIVLRHLAGSSDSTPQTDLRDLSEVLDLYPPPVEDQPSIQPEEQVAPEPADPTAADHPGEAAEPEKPLAVPVEEMSDTMREAWRRLRGSAGFRPELFRAWEQSGDEPFPELRIHDDVILFQVEPGDPLADVPRDEHGALVFTDQTLQQGRQALADDSAFDTGQEAEPPLPQYYFRIDGTANLTRTRFLHLDLDIELREPLYDPMVPATGVENASTGMESATDTVGMVAAPNPQAMLPTSPGTKSGPAADATAFRIHRIDQRRQVKTEQMEYFDGPVIGILALVTGFDVVPEESTAGEMLEGLEEDPELAE